MKLISMTDFVLVSDKSVSEPCVLNNRLINYANFLKQPLKLEMFIPCVDGEPIEDPELTMRQGNGFTYYGAEDKDFDEYGKAEEKVLFEGFNQSDDIGIIQLLVDAKMNIESLIDGEFDLTLTETAKKKILG